VRATYTGNVRCVIGRAAVSTRWAYMGGVSSTEVEEGRTVALHRNFPRSPYAPLDPKVRWFPAAEEMRDTAYEKLLPPLVANVREGVTAWRDAKYAGVSATSRALLTWWFETVAVKVIDIFGNDTMSLVPVNVG
jgi:hypothetical protein